MKHTEKRYANEMMMVFDICVLGQDVCHYISSFLSIQDFKFTCREYWNKFLSLTLETNPKCRQYYCLQIQKRRFMKQQVLLHQEYQKWREHKVNPPLSVRTWKDWQIYEDQLEEYHERMKHLRQELNFLNHQCIRLDSLLRKKFY